MQQQHEGKLIGGSIEKAVRHEFKLEAKAILTEAWQKTKPTRWALCSALIIVVAISMFATIAISQYWGGVEAAMASMESQFILQTLVTLVIWPFLAGVEMMGIYHSINKPTKPTMVFQFLSRGSWVAITALFVSTLAGLGFQLFFVPGLYLATVLSLSVALVVERRFSPLTAVTVCIKTFTSRQGWELFIMYSVLFGCLVLIAIPAVLAASYPLLSIFISLLGAYFIVPLFYNLKGIVYRETFGVIVDHYHVDGEDNQPTPPSSNTFDA